MQKYSNIETELGYKIVAYHIDSVEVHRNTRRASVSFNFLREGQSIQTAYHILKRALGSDYQKILAAEKTIPGRLKKIVDTIEDISGLEHFGAYLTLLFEVDALIANEDRHLNNIAILEENGKYHYCPLFDNGEGLMLDNVKYPFDVETRGLMKHLRAKPFQCRFGTILSAARDLYGAQLKIVCSGFGDCREISGLVSADVQTIPERADFRCCAVADEEIFLIRRVRIIAKNKEERDIFLIPPNFLNEGSLFGGMLKLRNTLEAVVLVVGVTIPILKITVFSFTAKTILLCLTALPIGIFALIGVGGESLTAFLLNFFRFLRNRKMQYRSDAMSEQEESRRSLWQSEGEWPEEYGEEKKPKKSRKTAKGKANEPFPVEKIENGICYLRDKRYIKIIEVEPINFLLRSAREQRNIIYSYMSYLKISPVRMQIKVVSKKADISNHLDKIQEAIRREQDERCKVLLMDYYNLIRRIGLKEAVTRRFFIVFAYEPIPGSSKKNEEKDAVNQLEIAERTARTYLMQCGNNVVEHENADSFMA